MAQHIAQCFTTTARARVCAGFDVHMVLRLINSARLKCKCSILLQLCSISFAVVFLFLRLSKSLRDSSTALVVEFLWRRKKLIVT